MDTYFFGLNSLGLFTVILELLGKTFVAPLAITYLALAPKANVLECYNMICFLALTDSLPGAYDGYFADIYDSFLW